MTMKRTRKMVCKNEVCCFCGKRLNKTTREKFADGYPFGSHDYCLEINQLRELAGMLESSLVRERDRLRRVAQLLIDTVGAEGPMDAEGAASRACEIINELRKEVKPVRKNWYFTFGVGQENVGKYVKIFGTCDEARAEMMRRHGRAWAFQYKTAEEAGVYKWKLQRLSDGEE
jgi:hypothetical protein